MADTSEQMISMPMKTFIVFLVGIIGIAITVGGYKEILDNFGKVETKIDKMQKDIEDLKISNAKIETILNRPTK